MKVDKTTPTDIHQDIALLCPRCKADNIENLCCSCCGFCVELRDGIVYSLTPDRASYYAQFIADYEHVRAAEGRGSQDESFYLSLPYKDTTDRNSHQWRIRSKSYDYLVQNILYPIERYKKVLDLGAGNCWMSFRLAIRGHKPVAVDLLTNKNDGLGAAGHFNRHLPSPIPRFQAELNCLPFRNNQFDAVVFNASFHYSENYEATLLEAIRCLRPGGIVIVSDTPWYSREESGAQMIAERHAYFQQRFETASNSVKSLEFLTDERLRQMEQALSIRWTVNRPWYGCKWAVRPWVARLRGRREPSRFQIYVAKKHA